MGRLTTYVAAIATDADNLGSFESLPKISFIDALLPRSFKDLGASNKEQKPLDPNIGRKHTITYYDIKKDSSGRKSIIAHRSSGGRSQGGATPAAAEEDRKKDTNGGKGKADEKSANDNGNGNGGGGGDNKAWTPEEDVELRKFKEANQTWKEIAGEMKRSQAALKARWKEISRNAGGGGGDASKAEEKKGDGGKENEGGGEKGGGGKKGGGGGQREFTAEDDSQLMKLKDEGKEWREIAKEMKRDQKQLRARWGQLGGDAANTSAVDKAKSKKEESKPKKEKDASPAKPLGKAALKAKSVASSRSNRGEEARFTLAEWHALQQNNGLFSIGELQLLSELIMNDQGQTWGRIASRFYDKTGRRVHAEDVRECFERFAAVS